MSPPFDPVKLAAEVQFLTDYPHFDQRPASIEEFLGDGYLEIDSLVRPGIKQALIDIFGDEPNPARIAHVERAMVTGAIGIGKTTFASIALPYMAHYVLCLKDPQAYYKLLPGSRIAFMQMSTSEDQAKEVVFGDIFARIKHSPWFVNNFPHDPTFKNQIRFPKDIWILPGDSAETTFEGYNILGGILDEMDSHKITPKKDYAEEGYNTIESRIASRFEDPVAGGHKGLLICIGQMKSGQGFANRKYKQMLHDPKAHVVRMTIWESLGWSRYLDDQGERKSFFYDAKRKKIIPKALINYVDNPDVIEIPLVYLNQFENGPEKALRDLAGIPPEAEDVFISLVDRIEDARDAYIQRHGKESPVDTSPTNPQFEPWFVGSNDPRKRVLHVDLAVSANGDAVGISMGHIIDLVESEGDYKPRIGIDFMLRMKAAPGTEIILGDIRQLIYHIRDDLHFNLKHITLDGFQSTDTMQQLRKRRFWVDYLSVDKSTLPYEDLREAIYERRFEMPKYMTFINRGDVEVVEIAMQELMRLQYNGKKVDHPTNGSKDVADSLAGVTYTLMGDRSFRRGVQKSGSVKPPTPGDDWVSKVSLPPDEIGFDGSRPGMPSSDLLAGLTVAMPKRLQSGNGSPYG